MPTNHPSQDPEESLSPEELEAKAQAAAKRREEQHINDLKWVLADKRGRRYVAWLLERAGIYRSSFTGNSETFFREGARNLGLQVVAEIHDHSPDSYVQLLKEYRANE